MSYSFDIKSKKGRKELNKVITNIKNEVLDFCKTTVNGTYNEKYNFYNTNIICKTVSKTNKYTFNNIVKFGRDKSLLGNSILFYGLCAGTDINGTCIGASTQCLTDCNRCHNKVEEKAPWIHFNRLMTTILMDQGLLGYTILSKYYSTSNKVNAIRINLQGDIDRQTHIDAIDMVAKELKQIPIFGYTRSWMFYDKILKLINDNENIIIRESLDDSRLPLMSKLPKSYMFKINKEDEKIYRNKKTIIAHNNNHKLCTNAYKPGKKRSCSVCGLCYKNKDFNVAFMYIKK